MHGQDHQRRTHFFALWSPMLVIALTPLAVSWNPTCDRFHVIEKEPTSRCTSTRMKGTIAARVKTERIHSGYGCYQIRIFFFGSEYKYVYETDMNYWYHIRQKPNSDTVQILFLTKYKYILNMNNVKKIYKNKSYARLLSTIQWYRLLKNKFYIYYYIQNILIFHIFK